MTHWEYRYIELYRYEDKKSDAFEGLSAEVGQAGREGWEAVGQVTFSWHGDALIPFLMLKRKVDAS